LTSVLAAIAVLMIAGTVAMRASGAAAMTRAEAEATAEAAVHSGHAAMHQAGQVIERMARRDSLPAVGPLALAFDVAPNGAISTISDAVRRAAPGAVITIRAGVYREPTIVVDRRVTLVGDSGAVIDGASGTTIMSVAADSVVIRGLTFRRVSASNVDDRAAIKVSGVHGCTIEGNRIDDGFFGIYLANVEGCRIAHNVLRASGKTEASSGNGIHLWSSRHVVIEDNDVRGYRDGIYFEFVHDTDVRRNVSAGNLRYGLHFMYSDDCVYTGNTFQRNGSGVAVMYTKRVTMTGNRFEGNEGAAAYGLLLKEISDPHLEGNAFVGNTTALVADGANRIIARGNEFIDNGWAVRLDGSTVDGQFSANDFVGNTFDVTTNTQTPSSTFAGNYWDAYRGYDLDRNGVGDVPHHPVRLFSMIVQRHGPALILLRSAFVDLLDASERALPSLTPETLADPTPAMRRLR
jgi:nitrous oxidase accessory protein